MNELLDRRMNEDLQYIPRATFLRRWWVDGGRWLGRCVHFARRSRRYRPAKRNSPRRRDAASASTRKPRGTPGGGNHGMK